MIRTAYTHQDRFPLPDRFQQVVAVAVGAILGYQLMSDIAGLWFQRSWERYPWMLGGALAIWMAVVGIHHDARISGPVRRALWWSLYGLAIGYVIQVLYLLKPSELLNISTLLPIKAILTQLVLLFKGDVTGTLSALGNALLDVDRFTGTALVGLIVVGVVLMARAAAHHLDRGLRHGSDPDLAALDGVFRQRQRTYGFIAMALTAVIVLLKSTDPRVLDFSESLSLDWIEQHLAIFGFIGGYVTESRRLARDQRGAKARAIPWLTAGQA